MAIVFSPNVVEIAVVQTTGGHPAVNVWHMFIAPELWPADVEAVVRDFANNWQDHIVPMQDDSTGLVRFDYRSLDPDDTGVGTLTPDPTKPTVGSRGNEAHAPNTAVLLHKNTATRPRGRRDGRSYVPGIVIADADDSGELSTLALTDWTAAAADLYNGISDTGVWTDDQRYPVVLETTPASRAPGSTPVTISSRRLDSITPDRLLATQRERLRR